jgi:hypothetical protein
MRTNRGHGRQRPAGRQRTDDDEILSAILFSNSDDKLNADGAHSAVVARVRGACKKHRESSIRQLSNRRRGISSSEKCPC